MGNHAIFSRKKGMKILNTTNLLQDIQLNYNQFTKTEKKIADFVIGNVNRVLFMSITDLAEASGVADASVYRFCRSVGAKGYQDFKMKLSFSVSTDEMSETETEDFKIDSLEYTLDKILQNHISVLKDTRMLINQETGGRTLRLMEAAKNIYFFGIGDSLLTAKEARNKFLRICNKVNSIDDPHMQAMTASMAGAEDLIFIISYSGATKDNVYVAEIAKRSGAKVIGITHFIKSPLTNYTDVLLVCGSNEGPLDGGAMGTKLSQLYVIDVLFHEYYSRNKQVSVENNKKTSRAVVDKLY